MKQLTLFACVALVITGAVIACNHPEPLTPVTETAKESNYPAEIEKIFIGKCATTGCHNEASYSAAGNLRLDEWKYLFDGSSNGAVVVPYSTENSSLLYFINTKPERGPVVAPTMPYNMSPLSDEEYNIIRDWIANGAPDKDGNVAFASDPDTRQKAYLTQQGCDLLGVIDVEKKVIMRYIKIGENASVTEAPHFIKVDNNGVYAYTCFTAGSFIQKIDTRTDKIVGKLDLSGYDGGLNWNVLNVSPDGKRLAVSQLQGSGNFLLVDAENMTVIKRYPKLSNGHGIAANKTFDTFYVTNQYGNYVHKVLPNLKTEAISLDGNPPTNVPSATTMNPHEIMMTPDYTKFFTTCENTNDIRVISTADDQLMKIIPVGTKPQEMAISKAKPYLFVSCMEDESKYSSLYRGSIYIINYNTLEIVKRLDGPFFQPHGIAVDDKDGIFFIASRNARSDGPAPHHVSSCAGRNGYYQAFDMNTFEPVESRRHEVTPDPYSFDMRFKQ